MLSYTVQDMAGKEVSSEQSPCYLTEKDPETRVTEMQEL